MTPQEEAQALAREIMQLSRSTLLTELRFLAPALCRMPEVDDPDTPTFATDGEALRYGFLHVLRRWREDRAWVLRAFLHMVLHCVYHHPFVDTDAVLPLCWDLACDIATEAAIDDLRLPALAVARAEEAAETLAGLKKALKGRLSAERIYRHYAESGLSAGQLERLRAPFLMDDHGLWYQHSRGASDEDKGEGSEGDGRQQEGQGGGQPRQGQEGRDNPGGGRETSAQEESPGGSPQRAESAAQDWRRIAAQVQSDLESCSREWADRAGSMLINLREGRRSRLRYGEFLRRFAVLTEVPEADPDSWDPLLYVYGMQLYGRMPLIEPLEFSERHRVRQLAIVIDTSGSVQGEKVQAFLTRTGEMLLAESAFDRRTELHFIECDARVQRDTVVTDGEALAAFTQGLQLHGGGGTDFRPAFQYIEGLQAQGKLTELRGILYFTDGDGTYPAEPPRCDVAFLFTDREDLQARVPPWAIRVLLDPHTLDQPEILYFDHP